MTRLSLQDALRSFCEQFLAGFAACLRLISVDSNRNRAHGYVLTWQPSLWGGGALERHEALERKKAEVLLTRDARSYRTPDAPPGAPA